MKIQEKINKLIYKHIISYAKQPNRIIIDIDNLDKLKKELGVRNTETLTEYMGCKVFVWFEDNTIEVFKKAVMK